MLRDIAPPEPPVDRTHHLPSNIAACRDPEVAAKPSQSQPLLTRTHQGIRGGHREHFTSLQTCHSSTNSCSNSSLEVIPIPHPSSPSECGSCVPSWTHWTTFDYIWCSVWSASLCRQAYSSHLAGGSAQVCKGNGENSKKSLQHWRFQFWSWQMLVA